MEQDEGYSDALMRASLNLIGKEYCPEIQWHGCRIFMHLLRFRWKETSITECGNFVNILELAEKLAEPSTILASKRAGTNFIHAKAVDKLFELLASDPTTCQDHSKPHSGRLLTCSSPVHVSQVVDKCPSILEDGSGVSTCITDHSKELNQNAGPEKLDIGEETGDCLVEEHNILSEAFTFVASCPWIQNYTELLSCLLVPLSKIWSQPEWETNLLHYFCDDQFRKSVHDVAVYFEKELTNMSEKSNGIGQKVNSNYSSLTNLLPLVLPHLLKLLHFVHSLWTDEVASIISEELEGAKYIMCSAESSALENKIRVWLQNIREIGYKVVGMCAYLEGAFHKWLDSTFVCDALMKDLESMEFRHLTLLIKYTIIPLVKNCPSELWTKWIDTMLQPLFHYCDYTLHSSWCDLLYGDTVQIPDIFGDTIESKEAEKLGRDLLFKLTREASNLLAAIALPELNGGIEHENHTIDLESIFLSSLVGYLLYHDCLKYSILRLITNIFGCWTDGDARIRVVPFCHSLIRLATLTHNDEIISFVKDNIIPNVIQYLALQLSSDNKFESSSDSDSGTDVLTTLCLDAYNCIQNQASVGKGISNAKTFKRWLSEQKMTAHDKNTSSDELEESVRIQEIEEEFLGYLPTYTSMLHAVDVFGDNLQDCHFLRKAPELMNEFISENAVDSCTHSSRWTMSSILSRKISSMYWKKQNEQMFKFYRKLVTFKPYIKYSGYDESVQLLIEDNSEEWSTLAKFHKNSALEFFCRILDSWEPQFHPLIREGHKDLLIEIAEQLTSAEYIDSLQPFQADSADFSAHLQPCVQCYIDDKNKRSGFDKAKGQAKLHKEFDLHLASGALDPFVLQGDFLGKVHGNDILCGQFSDLDHDLLEMSFERRAKLVNEQNQLLSYVKHMENIVANEELRDGLEKLITELEAEGFFCVDDDSIEWGKKRFSELVDKFQDDLFAALDLPKYYVIRGIMDFWQMLRMKDRSLEEAFATVVGGAHHRWKGNLHLFWMDTRYYKHPYYDIIQDPIKKISED